MSTTKATGRTVNNLDDFLKARLCSETTFDAVKRNTYKYTNCGAWIMEEIVDGDTVGITVGSIVEGVDWDVVPITLKYPFKIDSFWEAQQAVEDEADGIWKDTHGCDDCGILHPEYGTQVVNPKCKSCEGDGVIV